MVTIRIHMGVNNLTDADCSRYRAGLCLLMSSGEMKWSEATRGFTLFVDGKTERPLEFIRPDTFKAMLLEMPHATFTFQQGLSYQVPDKPQLNLKVRKAVEMWPVVEQMMAMDVFHIVFEGEQYFPPKPPEPEPVKAEEEAAEDGEPAEVAEDPPPAIPGMPVIMLGKRPLPAELIPLLDTHIDTLELGKRVYNCLTNDNKVTIGAILTQTEAELLRIPNFGRSSLNELKEALAPMDFVIVKDEDNVLTGWEPTEPE